MREPFRNARRYLILLLATEIFIGCVIISVVGAYQYILSAYMDSVGRALLFTELFTCYTLAFQMIITYVTSLAIWKYLWLRSYSNNVKFIIKIWLAFCFLIILCGFSTIWSLFSNIDGVIITVQNTLKRGIDEYYTCPEWKLLWDGLQYHKECCGVYNYKDWMNAVWMPKNESALCGGANGNGKGDVTILAPYACCKHDCETCFQNYMPRHSTQKCENPFDAAGGSGSDNQLGPRGGVPHLSLNQINKDGCSKQYQKHLFYLLYSLVACALVAFKLNLIICGLVKMILRSQNSKEGQSNCDADCEDDCSNPACGVECIRRQQPKRIKGGYSSLYQDYPNENDKRREPHISDKKAARQTANRTKFKRRHDPVPKSVAKHAMKREPPRPLPRVNKCKEKERAKIKNDKGYQRLPANSSDEGPSVVYLKCPSNVKCVLYPGINDDTPSKDSVSCEILSGVGDDTYHSQESLKLAHHYQHRMNPKLCHCNIKAKPSPILH